MLRDHPSAKGRPWEPGSRRRVIEALEQQAAVGSGNLCSSLMHKGENGQERHMASGQLGGGWGDRERGALAELAPGTAGGGCMPGRCTRANARGPLLSAGPLRRGSCPVGTRRERTPERSTGVLLGSQKKSCPLSVRSAAPRRYEAPCPATAYACRCCSFAIDAKDSCTTSRGVKAGGSRRRSVTPRPLARGSIPPRRTAQNRSVVEWQTRQLEVLVPIVV